WPDPLAPPTATHKNPHEQRSRQGTLLLGEPTSGVAYTDASFPKIVISHEVLVGNLHPEQWSQIEPSVDDYCAILPYGTGNAYFLAHPYVKKDITDFLKQLCFRRQPFGPLEEGKMREEDEDEEANPDMDDLSVTVPVQAPGKDAKDRFGKPWPLFLARGSQRLREYLLHQQTFAITPDLTFSVIPIDPTVCSWAICNFGGDSVTPNATGAILEKVKVALWKNAKFCQHVDAVMAKHGIPGSAPQRVVRATSTFTVTIFNNRDAQGNPAPIAQLRGRPITTDHNDHQTYLRLIRRGKYWIGLNQLEINIGVDCQLCKADTHPTWDCPFHQTEGWYGPKYDGAERLEHRVKRAREAEEQVSTNTRGGTSRGRGRRGGRGGSRGGNHGG
ncbi:uncharacterized protein C8Q71DRAFT_672765, partial [Rhodofomes roseus]